MSTMLRQTSAATSVASSAVAAAAPAQLHATGARALHTAAILCTRPQLRPFEKYLPPVRKPLPGLELVASRHSAPVQTNNYNERVFGAAAQAAQSAVPNTQLTMALLLRHLQEARKNKQSGNILLSPISQAQALKKAGGAKAFESLKLSPQALKAAQETDYEALLNKWQQSGDVTLAIGAHDGKDASDSFARTLNNAQSQEDALRVSQMSHMVELPFPLHEAASATGAASAPSVSSSLSFHGYLAPRFTSPATPFPNYFFDESGVKRIAHMMVKTANTWYVEADEFQMLDLPYLNPGFVATLVLPRASGDRTIQDHPQEFEYDQAPRRASTVDQVLQKLSTPMKNGQDVFAHHARHMALLPGLVGLPGFTADSVVGQQRAVLTLSPHGLDVGAKTPRQRTKILPNFSALAEHPFLFFVRSVDPAAPHVVFAAVINSVFERKDFATKFPLPAEWRDYKEQTGKNIKQLYSKFTQQ